MSLPTLFLDVDGVLSPVPDDGRTPPDTWRHWETVFCEFPCLFARDMGDAIASLPVNIVWLTTWEDQANELIAPYFGWAPLPVIDRRYHSEEPWWKLNAVVEHIRTGQGPFVWVDDELRSSTGAVKEFIYPETDQSPSWSKLLGPDYSVGITPADIEDIRQWLG